MAHSLFQHKIKSASPARCIGIGLKRIGLPVRTISDGAGTNVMYPVIPGRNVGITKLVELGLGLTKNIGLAGNSANDAADDGSRNQA